MAEDYGNIANTALFVPLRVRRPGKSVQRRGEEYSALRSAGKREQFFQMQDATVEVAHLQQQHAIEQLLLLRNRGSRERAGGMGHPDRRQRDRAD